MVIWSPSQTGGFPPGTLVSSHTKTIRMQTSVPTSMINISCITCFVIIVKYIKFNHSKSTYQSTSDYWENAQNISISESGLYYKINTCMMCI